MHQTELNQVLVRFANFFTLIWCGPGIDEINRLLQDVEPQLPVEQG